MLMLSTNNNKTLYPSNWEYNACLIIKELCKVIENHDGRVKPSDCTIKIVNRGYAEIKQSIQMKLNRIQGNLDEGLIEMNDKRKAYIEDLQKQLNEIDSQTPEPVEITHGTYISFILDNTYYYVELNDNPFFDFHYQKTPINNGIISKDAYLEELDKSFLWDNFLRVGEVAQADYIESANILFNTLISAPCSEKYRDKKRVRVPNTYNGGYHYETVYEKERTEKIDF